MNAGANLVATLFATLAAEMSDPDRFRRGRAYGRDRAVSDVVVEPGVAQGSVWGSRGNPYAVTVAVRPVRRAVATAATAADGRPSLLVPRPDDLTIACNCPDWGDPCKHGVAMLFELGELFARTPDALARWRQVGNPLPDTPDATRRAGARQEPKVDALDDFFGTGYEPDPIAALPRLARRPRGYSDDTTNDLVVTALDDALATLAALLDRR